MNSNTSFDSKSYDTNGAPPPFQDQVEFLADLVTRLQHGDVVTLSKQDARMFQEIAGNMVALKLILSSRNNVVA